MTILTLIASLGCGAVLAAAFTLESAKAARLARARAPARRFPQDITRRDRLP